MSAHKKAAGTEIDSKTFSTLEAKFAMAGHVLQRQRLVDDGRYIFTIQRWGQARSFTNLHCLQEFLNRLDGSQNA